MKSLSWLKDLQNFAGVVIGIIMVAIGSTLFLNSALKLYVFGFETESYFSAQDRCQNEYKIYPGENMQANPTRSPKEREECISEETEYEKKRYIRGKQENMIDGSVMVLVGFPLWFFHRNRKTKKSNKNTL